MTGTSFTFDLSFGFADGAGMTGFAVAGGAALADCAGVWAWEALFDFSVSRLDGGGASVFGAPCPAASEGAGGAVPLAWVDEESLVGFSDSAFDAAAGAFDVDASGLAVSGGGAGGAAVGGAVTEAGAGAPELSLLAVALAPASCVFSGCAGEAAVAVGAVCVG